MTSTGYAGVWHTDFGRMELKVEGNRVTGVYGPNAGRLEGVLGGDTVIGTWRQSAPGAGGATWGTFRMTFTASGESFTCRWEYQDNLAPGWGNWYGRRESASGWAGASAAVRSRAAAATDTLTGFIRPVWTPSGGLTTMARAADAVRRVVRMGEQALRPPTVTTTSRFAGKWDTDHGEMELRVVGRQVTGTYGLNDGQLDGVVSGQQVRGTWRQKSPCACGMTWGTVTLTLSADGRTFTGLWHYQDECAPGWGNWYGSRQTAATARA